MRGRRPAAEAENGRDGGGAAGGSECRGQELGATDLGAELGAVIFAMSPPAQMLHHKLVMRLAPRVMTSRRVISAPRVVAPTLWVEKHNSFL